MSKRTEAIKKAKRAEVAIKGLPEKEKKIKVEGGAHLHDIKK